MLLSAVNENMVILLISFLKWFKLLTVAHNRPQVFCSLLYDDVHLAGAAYSQHSLPRVLEDIRGRD